MLGDNAFNLKKRVIPSIFWRSKAICQSGKYCLLCMDYFLCGRVLGG